MSDDTAAALRRIEEIEMELHARDDPMADDVSDLRRVAGRALMTDAYATMVGEMEIGRGGGG
ncbi:hypothetical protein DQW50_16295 [Halorubrum sp. 48-1-W]|uniref:hypothetical protein n=1 Tax=Halorubrum sp. 48-1-W TaxID=2249761 RepID=UPI000DCC2A85|nr:hypothetical protein [Halorubrum sp. 48-1-W]RAW44082.1 hypothetical protein DQW50_16295 [Halorubrum sp. 48-1-W]